MHERDRRAVAHAPVYVRGHGEEPKRPRTATDPPVSDRVGIDTGGTFTDFVRLGPDGLQVHKVRSTPADPAAAILSGLGQLAGASATADVVHGSTVATNAVLERKGARVALVTTDGFQDVIRIGRQTRAELYNIFSRCPDRSWMPP